MKASIVIATHRRNSLLRWNLFSIAPHRTKGVEVLIMDDSHEGDEECRSLAKEYRCKYIHSGQTKGADHWRIPGFAFNIGAKLALGDVLVLSCAEVYHPLNTLKAMFSVVEDEYIVIPRCIRDDNGSVLGQLLDNLIPTTKSIERLKSLDSKLPFFMGMKRQRFLDIGGYDEDFTGVCWDDNDLTERLILSGGKYVALPMDVVHLNHSRHDYRSREIMQRWNHNKMLYDKRRGMVVRNQEREWGVL